MAKDLTRVVDQRRGRGIFLKNAHAKPQNPVRVTYCSHVKLNLPKRITAKGQLPNANGQKLTGENI